VCFFVVFPQFLGVLRSFGLDSKNQNCTQNCTKTSKEPRRTTQNHKGTSQSGSLFSRAEAAPFPAGGRPKAPTAGRAPQRGWLAHPPRMQKCEGDTYTASALARQLSHLAWCCPATKAPRSPPSLYQPSRRGLASISMLFQSACKCKHNPPKEPKTSNMQPFFVWNLGLLVCCVVG